MHPLSFHFILGIWNGCLWLGVTDQTEFRIRPSIYLAVLPLQRFFFFDYAPYLSEPI